MAIKASVPEERIAPEVREQPAPAVTDHPRRRFTCREVERMVEAGIVGPNEPLELIEGLLVEVTPQGPIHAGLLTALTRRLSRAYSDEYAVRQDAPIDAGPETAPEPDVAVAIGSERTFLARHPGANEIILVVEVAHTSHAFDHFKATIYARANIPTYWLIDVPAKRIEVYEDPQPDGRYRVVHVLAGADTVTPPRTDVVWTVAELLP